MDVRTDVTVAEVNQCDGCCRGLPAVVVADGSLPVHMTEDGGHIYMACCAEMYEGKTE